MSYKSRLSLKEIIDDIREGSISVIVYDQKTNVYLLIPMGYDELLEHLSETKKLCFYDDKGNIMVTEPGFFSVNNYDQSKLEKIVGNLQNSSQKGKITPIRHN